MYIHTYTPIHVHTSPLSPPLSLPLLLPPLPQFPSLCRQFYTLVNYICESFPERLPSLPDQLFLSCMHLLESGLHDYGVEVTILCLESIEGVAVCRRKDEALQSSPALTHILEHFLKVHVHNVLYTSTCTVTCTCTCTCTQCTCIIMIVHVQSCMYSVYTAYDRYSLTCK